MLNSIDLPNAMQAVAALFRIHGTAQISAVRLLKLLYIADRESIKETGHSITGDQAIATKHGPQLRELHQLIMGEHAPPPIWACCFRRLHADLEWISEPESPSLSSYESAKLKALTTRYAACSDEELQEITRDFDEWKKSESAGSCACIPLDEILRAVGRSAEQETLFHGVDHQAKPPLSSAQPLSLSPI